MEIKLFDSEVKVMEFVWEHEPITAKELSVMANERYEWNKNTTYTVIKKLIDKGAIQRTEPNFVCTSLIKKEIVQKEETNQLITRLFRGSKKAFFAAFLQDENLSNEEYEELQEMIEKRRGEIGN
ncbi:BlaI/MecI/CopY family transcriptional regulator [Anaerosporobacter sp.]|uniref:BlaI/MecI/CopY family transcriptional regulator n=1 Tax=Anaerosporobacter sp. TaxID=1872529 RepID=UPI002F4077D7